MWTYNVLDFELRHGQVVKADLLNHLRIVFGRFKTLLLRLCSCADHFAWSEDKRGSLRLPDAHDHSSESLRVIFRILALKSNVSEIEFASQVSGGDNVLELGSIIFTRQNRVSSQRNVSLNSYRIGLRLRSHIAAITRVCSHCRAGARRSSQMGAIVASRNESLVVRMLWLWVFSLLCVLGRISIGHLCWPLLLMHLLLLLLLHRTRLTIATVLVVINHPLLVRRTSVVARMVHDRLLSVLLGAHMVPWLCRQIIGRHPINCMCHLRHIGWC